MQLMQVMPSCGQICNSCKWRYLLAKFATNASGAIWWSNLQLMQLAPSGGQICKFIASSAMLLPNLVTESISGSVVPLAMFLTWGRGGGSLLKTL